MILQCLYQFAQSRQLLDDIAFKNTPVRWIIDLDTEGNLIRDGVRDTTSGDDNRAKSFDVPKTTRPKNSGKVADFLVDDIGAIFGLNPKPQKELNERAFSNLSAKNRDFWRQIKEAGDDTGDVVFEALVRFHLKLADSPPEFLRLDKVRTPKWFVKTASGSETRLGNDYFTFAVGELLINRNDIRSYWRGKVDEELEAGEESAQRGVCLITGKKNVPIALTHTPMVTSLPKPAKSTGAGIVGFDKHAFRSYGFKKSYNASSSISASKAYLLALQYLSSRENHWLALGPAWLCFWAAETEQASNLFAQLLHKPDTLTVRKFMTSPWRGLPTSPPDLEKFYAITLTATVNTPRIVVKDWLQVNLGEAVEKFKDWFRDLEIKTIDWGNLEEDNAKMPLSIRKLAHSTLRPDSRGRFDEDKLDPNLVAQLYRAALTGSTPSITLLKPLLERLKANITNKGTRALYDQSRFALLRLIVNRHHRNRKELDMEIPQKLPAKNNDPAYNSGRLLSVLNNLQRSAHDGKLQGASIAERYYGSASTNPSAAFSILWRLHQHHLKKLRQKGEKGQKAAHRIRENITEICALITPVMPGQPPQLPRVFMLVEQARFALGFYHQEAARVEAVRLWKEKQQATGKPNSDEDIPEENLFGDNQL